MPLYTEREIKKYAHVYAYVDVNYMHTLEETVCGAFGR